MFLFLYLKVKKKNNSLLVFGIRGRPFGFHLVPVSDLTYLVGCVKYEGKVEVLRVGVFDSSPLPVSVPSPVIY